MLPSNGRRDPKQSDLARQIAERLADASPTRKRFSLRDSVLVGRLISGSIIVVSLTAAVAVVALGASWVLENSSPPTTQVFLGGDGDDDVEDPVVATTSPGVAGIFVTTTSLPAGPLVPGATGASTGVTIPAPVNRRPRPGPAPTSPTTSSPTVTVAPPTVTNPTQGPTTTRPRPPTTSTSSSTSTSTSTTSSTTTITEPPTSTTTSEPPATTTTEDPTTTSTDPETSTTAP